MINDVTLRDVTELDLPIFFEHQRDPEAVQIADFPSRDYESFMAHWKTILRDPTKTMKTIIFDGQVAGNIVSWDEAGEQDVGYWLGKEYWGKGIATRALSEFLGIMKVRPLVAYVAKHNIGSRRVLEKSGFKIVRETDGDFILNLGV